MLATTATAGRSAVSTVCRRKVDRGRATGRCRGSRAGRPPSDASREIRAGAAPTADHRQGLETSALARSIRIVTRVRPHPYYRRAGLDVYVDVPLSAWEAMLGTKVEVPTLDGPVTVTVPPGTSSGAKLRVKGRGIERAGEKGDAYAVMKVIVPKRLDDDDKAAVQKLAAKHHVDARADVPWK